MQNFYYLGEPDVRFATYQNYTFLKVRQTWDPKVTPKALTALQKVY